MINFEEGGCAYEKWHVTSGFTWAQGCGVEKDKSACTRYDANGKKMKEAVEAVLANRPGGRRVVVPSVRERMVSDQIYKGFNKPQDKTDDHLDYEEDELNPQVRRPCERFFFFSNRRRGCSTAIACLCPRVPPVSRGTGRTITSSGFDALSKGVEIKVEPVAGADLLGHAIVEIGPNVAVGHRLEPGFSPYARKLMPGELSRVAVIALGGQRGGQYKISARASR